MNKPRLNEVESFYLRQYKRLFKYTSMLTVLLFMLQSFQTPVQAETIASDLKISLKKENAALKVVMKEIEMLSNLHFFYNHQLVTLDKVISVDFVEVPLPNVLQSIFDGTSIDFVVDGRQIVLFEKEQQPQFEKTLAPTKVVTGIVTDQETGEPMPGVNVIVNGTATGTVTDVNGKFSIEVDNDESILIFSFIGYERLEIKVDGRSQIDVALKADIISLSEVLVVGYGTTTKEKNLASITTADPRQIKNLGVVNMADGLAGRVPGLIVTSSGGGPGARSVISIRGGGTPTYVIDGIISSELQFQTLNPNDIENISFLKDGAATAIYGVAAGNGVVLVVTKRGEQNRISVDYSNTTSLSSSTFLPERLNAYELVQIINKTADNEGSPRPYTDDVVEKYRTKSDPLHYPDVNWRDLTLNKYAPESQQNLSINGGSGSTKYFASFGYLDQKSLYKFNTKNLKRYNYRLSVTHEISKIGLKAQFSLSGMTERQQEPSNSYTTGLPHWEESPLKPAFADLAQTRYSANVDHALVEIDPRGGSNKWEDSYLKSLFNIEWNLPWLKGLSLKTNAQLDQIRYSNKNWRFNAPQYAIGSDVPVAQNDPQLSQGTSSTNGYTLQFLVDYKTTFLTNHAVTALLGYEEAYSLTERFDAWTTGYQLAVSELFAGPQGNQRNGGSSAEAARRAHLGRLTYSYKDKYLVEGSFRRDQSDWFPSNNNTGFFPSVAAGWVVSNEPFMNSLDDRNILNHLKIKYSYGTVGQIPDNFERFAYVPGYQISGGYVVDGVVRGTLASPGQLVSPDITWYSQKTSNTGIEFATLGNKLTGGFEYFYIRTTNYLAAPVNESYIGTLGVAPPIVLTDGAHRRAGFDMSLQYRNSIGKLNYTVGGNLVKFNQLWEKNPYEPFVNVQNPYSRTTQQVGFYSNGYHSLGLYQTADDILNNPRRISSILAPGDVRYEDTNGDGKIDGSDFRRIGSDAFPRSNYGVNIELDYGPWSLYLQLHGTSSRTYDLTTVRGLSGDLRYKFQTEGRWNPESGGSFPRVISQNQVNGGNNDRSTDAYFVDAAFMRVKATRLSYDLKHTLLKNIMFLRDCRLSLSGTNLFTFSEITKYNLDPEGNGYPVQRVYSLSLNVGL